MITAPVTHATPKFFVQSIPGLTTYAKLTNRQTHAVRYIHGSRAGDLLDDLQYNGRETHAAILEGCNRPEFRNYEWEQPRYLKGAPGETKYYCEFAASPLFWGMDIGDLVEFIGRDGKRVVNQITSWSWQYHVNGEHDTRAEMLASVLTYDIDLYRVFPSSDEGCLWYSLMRPLEDAYNLYTPGTPFDEEPNDSCPDLVWMNNSRPSLVIDRDHTVHGIFFRPMDAIIYRDCTDPRLQLHFHRYAGEVEREARPRSAKPRIGRKRP